MTPVEYESALAAHYRSMGYEVQLTPISGDYGIDLFATQGSRKLGIQAKMYGIARKVNREMIMQLHGASCYFDCTSAVLATDGQILPDAQRVATKLNIEIVHFCPEFTLPDPDFALAQPADGEPADLKQSSDLKLASNTEVITLSFDLIWEKYVMPLKGCVLRSARGRENTIINVNWAGVDRITSNEEPGHIPVEIFRSAIRHLLTHGSITRDEINQQYSKRASSGIYLILQQIPLFEHASKPKMTLTFKK